MSLSRPSRDATPGEVLGAPECPLCASREGRTYFREDWITIRRCGGCGFLYTEERAGDFRRDGPTDEIDRFYRWLEATRDERAPLLERRLERLASRFGLPEAPLSVLEVGTGGAALAHACSRLGHRYVGLEPLLGERFDLDVTRALPGVEVLPLRLEEFSSAESFDVAVMDNVLEHIARPVEAVRRLLDLLRPTGVLWVQVPNEANLVWKHRVLSRIKDRRITFPGHVNLFTRKSLRQCLLRAGAAEVEIAQTSASHPVLTRLLLMGEAGPALRLVMWALRATRLDVVGGRAYWIDAYARPPRRSAGDE